MRSPTNVFFALLLVAAVIALSACSSTNLSDFVKNAGTDGASYCFHEKVTGPWGAQELDVSRSNSPKAGSASATDNGCATLHNGDGSTATPSTAPTAPVAPTLPTAISPAPTVSSSPALIPPTIAPLVNAQARAEVQAMLVQIQAKTAPK